MVRDAVFGFLVMTIFVLGTIGYIFVALPDSFIYVGHFILTPSIHTALDPLVGIVIAIVGTGVMYFLLNLSSGTIEFKSEL